MRLFLNSPAGENVVRHAFDLPIREFGVDNPSVTATIAEVGMSKSPPWPAQAAE